MIYNGFSAKAREEGANIEYAYPDQGYVVWMDSVVLLKDAPNREKACVDAPVDARVFWTVWVNDQPVVSIDSPDKTCLVDCLKSQNQLRLRAEVVAGVQPTIREVSLKIA